MGHGHGGGSHDKQGRSNQLKINNNNSASSSAYLLVLTVVDSGQPHDMLLTQHHIALAESLGLLSNWWIFLDSCLINDLIAKLRLLHDVKLADQHIVVHSNANSANVADTGVLGSYP